MNGVDIINKPKLKKSGFFGLLLRWGQFVKFSHTIFAMPFALAMDFGYDLLLTIRLAALYPFLSAFLCFFFLRESQKLTDMRNLQ